VEDRLKNLPYPDPLTQIQIDPLPMFYFLPEYIFITENDDIKVGVWEDKEEAWATDLIDDLQYDKSARKLEFTTRKLAPIAYLQSRCTDYPYTSWKIRCVDTQKAILDIVTKRVHLTFEIGIEHIAMGYIKGAPTYSHPYVMLIEKTDSELRDIVNKKMSPGNLLMELSKCGIHLLPVDEDAKLGSIQLKSRHAEENAIIDIATSLRSFAFRSSKWNKHVEPENIVIKIRENLEYDREFYEDHEPDWKQVMWWPNKCAYVNCADNHEHCDTKISHGHETHAMLHLAIAGVAHATHNHTVTEEAKDRCNQYGQHIEFTDTIKKMLRLTRLLAFT
jgi:cancer susceptibility candidate protein 1